MTSAWWRLMSMDSRSALPESASRDLPGTRRRCASSRWRLFAITLWTAFLGATMTLVVFVALLPEDATLALGDLSLGFLCSWVLSMVPISLALMLALPLERHGR